MTARNQSDEQAPDEALHSIDEARAAIVAVKKVPWAMYALPFALLGAAAAFFVTVRPWDMIIGGVLCVAALVVLMCCLAARVRLRSPIPAQ